VTDGFCIADAPIASSCVTEYNLTINMGNGAIITIHPDGNVSLSAEISLTEASRAFWEAVTHCGVQLAAENAKLKARVQDLESENIRTKYLLGVYDD
jgi:hypothetical protein